MKFKTVSAHGLVLLATLLVAGSFVASAPLSAMINPYSLTLMRFIGAAFLLFPFIVFNKTARSQMLGILPRAAVMSAFYCLFFITFFEALKTTTPLNTGSLFTLMPLVTALLSAVLLKGKVMFKHLFVYALGALGAVLIITRGEGVSYFAEQGVNVGDGVFLISVLAMSLYTVSMKWLYRNDNMYTLVFCVMVCGAIWMSFFLFAFDIPLNWDKLSPSAFGQMSYLIIGATLLTSVLYQRSTVALGPERVSAYVFLNPLFVALIVLVIQQQSITLSMLPGIVITIAATIALQLPYFSLLARTKAELQTDTVCCSTKC